MHRSGAGTRRWYYDCRHSWDLSLLRGTLSRTAVDGAYCRRKGVGRVLAAPDRAGWLLRRDGSVSQFYPGLKGHGLDARLSDNEFICGPHFTIADITGMVTVDFCGWTKLTAPEHLTHLCRWHSAVSARPSAKA